MNNDWRSQPWTGVFPATLCAFHEDESLDEDGLRSYIGELAREEGVCGVTCNGHTGEIMSLRPEERNRVTAVVRDAVDAANAETGRELCQSRGQGRASALE